MALTGTPTAADTYTFDVTATDTYGFTGTKNYSVTIAAPTIVVSPGALPSGPQGQSVSQTLTGSGGLGPYTFAVTAGTLPPGLTLAPSGALTGTLTSPGTFTFTVTGTDANGFSGTRNYTISVGATVATTQKAIGSFMTHRAEAITTFDPFQARGRQRLLGRSAGGGGAIAAGPVGLTTNENGTRLAFSTSLSHALQASAANRNARMALGVGDGGGSIAAFSNAPGLDIWIEGHYTRFDTGTAGADADGHVGFLAIGADYLINPWFLIGAYVQIDDAEERSTALGTKVDGTGWMAGPYVDMRFTENLYFHAHGAWGTSDNSVNPLGTYTDDFETERWMARATLTGDWSYDRWRLRPQVSLAHFEEEQKSYVDSLGNFIPSQTLVLTRLSVGPEIAYRYENADGSYIESFASVMGLFDLESSGVATFAGISTGGEGARLRFETGVSGGSDDLSFHATGFYEGFGGDDYRGVGGELSVRVPLN